MGSHLQKFIITFIKTKQQKQPDSLRDAPDAGPNRTPCILY